MMKRGAMRGRVRAARAGVAILGLAAAAPGVAQEFRTDLSLGGEVSYESNLLRSNRLRGGFDGSDTRFTPSLGVNIARPIGRDSVSLSGTAGYDFYRNNTYLNRERIALESRAGIGLGAFCRTDLSAGIDFQQTDIADLGERIGNTSRVQSYSGSAGCRRKAGFSPRIDASRDVATNSQALRRRFDLDAYQIRGGIAYSRPSLGTIGLFYGVQRVAHPKRPLSDGTVGDRTVVQQYGVEIERAVSPRIAADLRILWIDAETRAGNARSFSGVGWATNLRWAPGARLVLAASLDRGVRGQSSFGASYTVATRARLNGDYTISHRTGAIFSVAHEKRDIRGEDPLSGIPPRGSDNSWVIGAGGHYDVFRNLSLQLGATYRTRSSRNGFYDYSSTGARLGARMRF